MKESSRQRFARMGKIADSPPSNIPESWFHLPEPDKGHWENGIWKPDGAVETNTDGDE